MTIYVVMCVCVCVCTKWSINIFIDDQLLLLLLLLDMFMLITNNDHCVCDLTFLFNGIIILYWMLKSNYLDNQVFIIEGKLSTHTHTLKHNNS